jgi:hypothetical protein
MSDNPWGSATPADGPEATFANGSSETGGPPPGTVPFGAAPPTTLTPEQLAYQRGQRDMYRRMTTPRMTVGRIICGILWAVISVAFGVGAIYNLVDANIGEAVFGLVICGLAGWYDYRIWTLKARRLWFII